MESTRSETYEERQARERQERRDLQAHLERLAEEIAEHLTDWIHLPPADPENFSYGNTKLLNGFMELSLSAGLWGKPDRLQISGSFGKYGYYQGHRITVSLFREPKDIAREIERRLLPDYIPLFHKAFDEWQQAHREANEAEQRLQEYWKIIGEENAWEPSENEHNRREETNGQRYLHTRDNVLSIHLRWGATLLKFDTKDEELAKQLLATYVRFNNGRNQQRAESDPNS